MKDLNITDMKVVPCVDSRFIAPSRVTFQQNGYNRTWDYIKVHDSVAILIYNTSRKEFVLVKQFRPAKYMNLNSKMNESNDVTTVKKEKQDVKFSVPHDKGVTYELCAGIVDQQRTLQEIAQSEVLEETGYKVPLENIQKLFTHHSIGYSGNSGTVYFTEVTDEMKVSEGGGNEHEGEFIEVFYLPLANVKEFLYSDDYLKPSSLHACFFWFLLNHSDGKDAM